ncbi:hypothetical protein YC2023_076962 [Brassica napus]
MLLGWNFPKRYVLETGRPSGRRWRWIYFKSFLCAMNGNTKTMMRTWERMSRYWMCYLYLNLMLLCTVVW